MKTSNSDLDAEDCPGQPDNELNELGTWNVRTDYPKVIIILNVQIGKLVH